jgi:hypothetical protein
MRYQLSLLSLFLAPAAGAAPVYLWHGPEWFEGVEGTFAYLSAMDVRPATRAVWRSIAADLQPGPWKRPSLLEVGEAAMPFGNPAVALAAHPTDEEGQRRRTARQRITLRQEKLAAA